MTDPVYVTDALIAQDIDAYLDTHQHKTMLRFITCGSVDDGKSTLIGRLLYDSKMIFEDQLAALENDSKKVGTQGQAIDFALLVDGLAAEREQGITIDVAYRFFNTEKRKFIVADCPGHEQYTRNMVTGASTADLAVILIDARKGVLVQTRRHSYLCHLLGIRNIVLAVNKMDLVDYSQARFDEIVAEYRAFASSIGIETFTALPISGFAGDNVTAPSANTPWYTGPSLIAHLETVPVRGADDLARPFRMPVQWVNRPNLDFRGFSGLISSGSVKPGDTVRVLPSGKTSTVTRIVTLEGDLDQAQAGQAVTLTLADEIDCSRGDVIALADNPPEAADQFEATLVWMADEALTPGRAYWLKLGTQTVSATVRAPEYVVNVNTMERLAAKTLELNAIGVAEVVTDKALVFEPYAQSRTLGGFILIDKITNATVGAGMLNFSLRRAQNVHWQALDVTRKAHAALKMQEPAVLWFTGLSGSGKSTIANLVEKKLHALGKHTFLLDGDNVRHGLNKDLGFTDADRIENIRRVGEVAKLMTDAGLIVLTAFISPFRAERELVRSLLPAGEFVEVFIDTPLEEAEKRDVKGLYKKARSGQLKNFTGIDSPYERPENPEIRVDTTRESPEDAAERIVERVIGAWMPVI
ncbi:MULTISPECIES: sulfate adenylyltransferase subunit CysN [unclassified Novosphingobium]|uniref:sulfate adenylyltransferase subunit CysN n=1 Tax=unclassified Novosphingobium TaxID=2644732 RepID=UPI0014947161|nr:MULTISPECIES: sulfate adenylyltransferase subunit CysN [unclassified Novosphingobium]MBB3357113.1 bifunctional enzyme CysN/CysC [Novosphingobium sp. BK256]MBB3376817.1 bifunctional enzyme CysN/CysC [Novosphingobium sp. BK280]MBB3377884.1 bifunctional enzyme CysN/CysC [Novosphingobium sp. BK258]MBB3418706.1 bifunctional enzyme CysN/CysC [Novosphingobium sp. BK267]MBB3451581.1 bifunctional enzyme CysN/CysC [Novosphingobium sp. BK352]